MIYKSYKFSNADGQWRYTVRFYRTGIYTITDKNGEHELGVWTKRPMLVGRNNDTPSKDKGRVIYRAVPFKPLGKTENTSLQMVACCVIESAVFFNQIEAR